MLKNRIESEKLEVEIKEFNNVDNIAFFRQHNIKAVPRLVIEDGDNVEIIQGTDDILKAIKEHTKNVENKEKA
jgi:predicted DsbA family dithiol-disulfide isomerase